MKVLITKLWPEIKQFKNLLILSALAGAFQGILKGTIPQLLNLLMDNAWKPNSANPQWIWQIPMAITVIWIMVSALRYFSTYNTKMISEYVTMNLRNHLMNKYLRLNLGFLHNFQSGGGGLISRMINDLLIVREGLHKISDLLSDPFMVLIAFASLLYLDWRLTIAIALLLPLVTGVSRRFARSLKKYSHKNQENMEELAKTLKESLDGSRIVQSFNLESVMQQRFQKQANDFISSQQKIIKREEAAGPISESLVAIGMTGILIYIGHEAIGGTMTSGKFTAFLATMTFLQDSARKVQNGYIKIQTGIAALERFRQLVDLGREVSAPKEPKKFPKDFKTIEYRNVSFSYGQEIVLKKINLTIKRGEIIALVGTSGSGKSTFVNLLERFYDPTEGEILVDGININQIDLNDLRTNVSLVSQDVFLFGDTIEKNISMGKAAGGNITEQERPEIINAAKAANAHNFILKAEKQYQTLIGDMGAGLSGGEKQRVSIARAIYKDSPVLILDEATSALDTESEREVQKGLDQLMQGRTTFVIAHRLSTIARASRILVFRKGEIVEQGSHDELIQKQQEYYKLLS